MYTLLVRVLCLLLLLSSNVFAQKNMLFVNKGNLEKFHIEMRYPLSDKSAVRISLLNTHGVVRNDEKLFRMKGFARQKTSLIAYDWHPKKSHFRTSIGFAVKSHEWNLMAEPTVQIDAGLYEVQPSLNDSDDILDLSGITMRLDKRNVYESTILQDSEHIIDNLRDRLVINSRQVETGESVEGHVVEVREGRICGEDLKLDANIRFQRYTPYIGFGWANPPGSKNHFQYGIDFGFLYNGSPDIDMKFSGDVFYIDEHFANELAIIARDKEIELAQKVKDIKFIPYFSLGLALQY